MKKQGRRTKKAKSERRTSTTHVRGVSNKGNGEVKNEEGECAERAKAADRQDVRSQKKQKSVAEQLLAQFTPFLCFQRQGGGRAGQ